MQYIQIPWAHKKIHANKILPLFIPFAGCPQRCIFCAQDLQSGTAKSSSLESPLKVCLLHAQQSLKERVKKGASPIELAFYGGTFTALPESDFALCTHFAQTAKSNEYCVGSRCSTRPDTIVGAYAPRLQTMLEAGFHTIELGVQSFDDSALSQAKRHYTFNTIQKACVAVKSAGFSLGVQLMPGMPGVSSEVFLQDVRVALELGADFLRFYPCQVIAGTELAGLWEKGLYQPWDLESCVQTLSEAWLMAHLAKVPVIRMGLAPETKLETHILAGPRHVALGNMVQAHALFQHIHAYINDGMQVHSLTVPKDCQGYFWGHGQQLRSAWASVHIFTNTITWHEQNTIIVEYTM